MIKDIVIVGGGFSGYMTGLLIKHAFGTDLWPELTITVIESSSIGTVGVGESTAQNVPILLNKVGIDPPYLHGQDRKVVGVGRRTHTKDGEPIDRRIENWQEFGPEERKAKKDRRKK